MGYKTGRTRTITFTANWTGSLPFSSNFNDPLCAVYFDCAAEGITFGGEITDDNNAWTIHATGGEATLPFSRDDFPAAAVDISGSITITIPNVEEWVDYGNDPLPTSGDTGAPTDADLGVFRLPALATLTLREVIPAGTVATIAMTSAGLTIDSTYTYLADNVPAYSATINASMGCAPDYADDPADPTGSSWVGATHAFQMTADYNGIAVIGGDTLSYSIPIGGGAVVPVTVDNLTGVKIDVSLPAAGGGGDAYNSGDPAEEADYGGSASCSVSPPKSFSVAGVNWSVDQPWPGSITMVCPRKQGDDAPDFTAGASYTRSGTQRRFSSSLAVAAHMGVTGPLSSDSEVRWASLGPTNVNEYASVTVGLDGGWCRDNDEFVTYQVSDGVNTATRIVPHSPAYLHAYKFNGLRLAQPATFSVDPCTATTGWTGATLAGGHLTNTGAGAMTRTWSPFFNFSGYRYLRLKGVNVDSGTQPFTLALGGKTWTRFKATTTPTDILIDLCDPDSPTARVDTQDTMYPDPNPTLRYGADAGTDDGGGQGDGPLWGVGYATTLTLSGFVSGRTYTFGGIELARHSMASVDMLSDWTPRWSEDMTVFGPEYAVPNGDGGDTLFTLKNKRGLIAKSDGLRQALELPDHQVLQTEPEENPTFYTPAALGIGTWADAVNGGGFVLGPGSIDTFAGYQSVPNGWTATRLAPAADGSENLRNGLLNDAAPSCWLMGRGAYYDGTTAGWSSGVGMALSSSESSGDSASVSLPAQVLATTVDFWPGCGDAFGLGPTDGSATQGTLYLGASWISRGQAWGGVLYDDHAPAGGKTVLLFPATGEIQPPGIGVGMATTDTDEGGYRTTGAGLDGYTSHTAPGPPELVTVEASGGTVTDVSDG